MSSPPLRILIIDDNEIDRELYRRLLSLDSAHQFVVLEAATGAEGLELCRSADPDCVLLDQRLPDCDGTDVLARLVQRPTGTPRPLVLLTGEWDDRVARAAATLGAREVVDKGTLDAESLAACVLRAVDDDLRS